MDLNGISERTRARTMPGPHYVQSPSVLGQPYQAPLLWIFAQAVSCSWSNPLHGLLGSNVDWWPWGHGWPKAAWGARRWQYQPLITPDSEDSQHVASYGWLLGVPSRSSSTTSPTAIFVWGIPSYINIIVLKCLKSIFFNEKIDSGWLPSAQVGTNGRICGPRVVSLWSSTRVSCCCSAAKGIGFCCGIGWYKHVYYKHLEMKYSIIFPTTNVWKSFAFICMYIYIIVTTTIIIVYLWSYMCICT